MTNPDDDNDNDDDDGDDDDDDGDDDDDDAKMVTIGMTSCHDQPVAIQLQTLPPPPQSTSPERSLSCT